MTCPECHKRFTPEKPWAKYDTRACANKARMRAYRLRLKKRA
jgi:hypothetical protein